MDFLANLAHQMALLTINPKSAPRLSTCGRADVAVAAATLAELVMQERVGLLRAKVHVFDPRPVGDPLLDAMLRSLGADTDGKPGRVISRGAGFYLDQALGDLVRVGWLSDGQPPGTRIGRFQVNNDSALVAARELAAAAIRQPERVAPRPACLGGLALVVGLGTQLAPEMGLRKRWAAQQTLMRRDWLVRTAWDVIQGC